MAGRPAKGKGGRGKGDGRQGTSDDTDVSDFSVVKRMLTELQSTMSRQEIEFNSLKKEVTRTGAAQVALGREVSDMANKLSSLQTQVAARPSGEASVGEKRGRAGGPARGSRKDSVEQEAEDAQLTFPLTAANAQQANWLGRALATHCAPIARAVAGPFLKLWFSTGLLPTEAETLGLVLQHALTAADLPSRKGVQRITKADLEATTDAELDCWKDGMLSLKSGVPKPDSLFSANITSFMHDGLLSTHLGPKVKNIIFEEYIGAPLDRSAPIFDSSHTHEGTQSPRYSRYQQAGSRLDTSLR